jgi:hypothetical protein
MIRVSLFSLVGVLVILGIGIKIGWLGHSYLHWFEARAPDVPSHHPVAAAEDAAAKAEHATTHAATAVVGKIDSTLVQLEASHERRKQEASTRPHPVKDGIREIGTGAGHLFDGVLHLHRPPATQP